MTQSFTKFYTEMHGVFLEKDCVERATQRRFTFFVSGFKLFLILFRNFGIKKERLPVKKKSDDFMMPFNYLIKLILNMLFLLFTLFAIT